MTRVLADTNVNISALMFGGLPGASLDLALSGSFTLVTSTALLDELEDKLTRKFELSTEDATAIRAKICSVADLVKPDLVLDAIPADPDDNHVLECAIAGRAN